MPTKFKLQTNTSNTGIEVMFQNPPNPHTRTMLKGNGWRWNRRSSVWYRKDSGMAREALFEMARTILGHPSSKCIEGEFERVPAPSFQMKAATLTKLMAAFQEAKPYLPKDVSLTDFSDMAVTLGTSELRRFDYSHFDKQPDIANQEA